MSLFTFLIGAFLIAGSVAVLVKTFAPPFSVAVDVILYFVYAFFGMGIMALIMWIEDR
jgi:hypothetical protein